MNALKKLRTISKTIAKNEARRAPVIEEARQEGATWEQIAEALHMSRAGVINLHNSNPSDK